MSVSEDKRREVQQPSRPVAPVWDDEKYPDDTAAWRYEDERDDFIEQANAYMDYCEQRIAELEADNRRLREALKAMDEAFIIPDGDLGPQWKERIDANAKARAALKE